MPRQGRYHGEGSGVDRRNVLKGLGVLTAGAMTGATLTGSVSAAIGDSAVYQYYHTDWGTIEGDLSALADAGYDAVQVPPAQFSRLYEHERSASGATYDPPLGYQPIDFTDFDSAFGTEAEYKSMVDEAHAQGLAVIADAVLNHLAAGDDYFERQVSMDDIPRFSEADLHPECSIDYDDPASVEDCWLVGLRDLDQSSSYVRGELRNYLQKYADVGVDGVRFDAAKHMPEWFFRDYANQWADEMGLFRVGEVLDGATATNQQYADTGMSVTDYSLYFTMVEDVFHGGGDMNALEGAGLVNQSPTRALTFVSNHDQGPPEYERLAYAYVLTYEGYPRVYSHRVGVDDDEIAALLSLRRNVLSGSATTRYVDTDLYVFERGEGLVVLNRGNGQRSERVQTNHAPGTTLTEQAGRSFEATVDGDGSVQVTAPAVGYAVYAPGCSTGGGTDQITLEIDALAGDGESVFFTGNAESLTNWGGGVEGVNTGGDHWEVTIDDPGAFEWKTRRGPAGGSGEVWEGGSNHAGTDRYPAHNGWEDR